MLKINDNPPVAWPQAQELNSFAGLWWVAHTKSRNEKALAQDLIAKDISYFLPMTWKVRHIRGRKIKSLLPLFGGYLFFCGDESQRVELLRTNRVANLIEVKDQQGLIRELTNIEQAIKAGATLQQHKYIEAGQKCRVTSGPLKNLEGIVLQTSSGARLILTVEMLGQAASAEVDTDSIEIIE